MRDRLILLAVLAAAAALAALLVFPRDRRAPAPAPTPAPAPVPAPVSAPASASASALPPLPTYVRLDPSGPVACGEGMVLVDGIYCPFVGHTCTSFLHEESDVCDRYAPEVLCEGRLQRRRFCIDVFEYPNLESVVPAVMADFNEARRACGVEGKRLCTVEEWEFACEGTEMWPYPYGTSRDATACNIDRPVVTPTPEALSDPWRVSDEAARLDERVPSGAVPRCISPFGVRDMTGNVDEWVENPNGKVDDKPYRSSLKGGAWGPSRARCRPITSSHGEGFSSVEVGFRCCRDARGGGDGSASERAMAPAPPGARIPRRQRMATPPPPSRP